jgi:hypothetical protein
MLIITKDYIKKAEIKMLLSIKKTKYWIFILAWN